MSRRNHSDFQVERGATRWWRIKHQWWFLLIVFPFAWLAWVAFGYLGLRLRRRGWIGAAVVYALVMLAGTWLVADGSSYDSKGETGAFVLLGLWAWTFAHSLIIRREALDRLRLHEDPRLRKARSRIVTRQAAEEIARRHPRVAFEAGIGRDLDSFGGLLDVNHARATELAHLPGFTAELAENVVDVREHIDGFVSVLDFATYLDLPPRLLDRLRDRLICLPR